MIVDGKERKPGEAFSVGSKIYMICAVCKRMIQINRPIFGSLHLCLTDEERGSQR